jgi:hypothetical protein
VRQPGYRTQELLVVTTLLDAERYTKEEVTDLYHERWHAEMFHPHYPSSAGLYRGRRAA